MIAPDVNVLIYAARTDAERHDEYRSWLERAVDGPRPLALSELVLSGLVRVVTNGRLFIQPQTLDEVFDFVAALRQQPNVTLLRPGPKHWEIFARVCRDSRTTGPRVSDAYHAALAIEHGCEWITTDRDFARFPGLRWRHPLDGGRR